MGKTVDSASTADTAEVDRLAAEAETEAAELKDDIKEAKQDAAEARAEGDTDRADRLEKRVGSLETKLDSVLDKITKLLERPFHPAPEERIDTSSDATPDDQGRTGDGAVEKDAAPEPGTDKPKPRGRRPSRAFFGSRADYDD